MKMKTYKSKKVVKAKPATSSFWKSWRSGLDKSKAAGYSDATVDDGIDGYIVCYDHGTDKEYWSFSPKDAFESGYDEISGSNLTCKAESER